MQEEEDLYDIQLVDLAWKPGTIGMSFFIHVEDCDNISDQKMEYLLRVLQAESKKHKSKLDSVAYVLCLEIAKQYDILLMRDCSVIYTLTPSRALQRKYQRVYRLIDVLCCFVRSHARAARLEQIEYCDYVLRSEIRRTLPRLRGWSTHGMFAFNKAMELLDRESEYREELIEKHRFVAAQCLSIVETETISTL